jgi:hypothetical protein
LVGPFERLTAPARLRLVLSFVPLRRPLMPDNLPWASHVRLRFPLSERPD